MKPLFTFGLLMYLSFPSFSQPVFHVRDEGEGPSRSYHVVHYRIEVSFDELKKMVVGKTTITLVPFLPDLSIVQLDAENIDVHSVFLEKKALRYELLPTKLAVTLNKPYSFNDTLTFSVDYSCTPSRGLYFVQPDSGYPNKPWQIWSQGEDMDNHYWFPCYDFPNDMATSELIATVKNTYVALSNGRLLDVNENKANKTRTFHWRQDIPHASYLISLAAGEYAILKDKVDDIPIEYYVYPAHIEDARACFASTPDMVRWFSDKIGIKYPWAKYAQVLIKDFIEGGMENITATSLADDDAVYDARARVDNSPTSLIAHELAHQWWGDAVTCKDWRHLWLNESFATYFDHLWHEHALGRDEFDYLMYGDQQSGINSDKRAGRKPIVSIGSYVANIYPRGASVLHMLRFVLGDQLFWRAIHYYIAKNQHASVETNDFKEAIQEATGQNLYWFFDQWVYKAGHPVFDLSYTWNDSARSVLLSVSQTQQSDSLTGIFHTPVDIELTLPDGRVTRRVNILSKDTTFVISVPARPVLVIFDKGNWLLKEMNWSKSVDAWIYQAEYAPNPVDRLRAMHELAREENSSVFIPLFSRIAITDSFWAVRREAVLMLDNINPADSAQDEAIAKTLIVASSDAKPAVRIVAVSQLRSFREATVIQSLFSALRDSSYNVVGAALTSLAKVDSSHALPVLLGHLEVPSYKNIIATAALNSIALIDTTKAIEVALVKGRYGQPVELRYAALDILSRHGKGMSNVSNLLTSILSEKQSWVRLRAIRALGDIGEQGAILALQKIADDKTDRSAEAARASIERIRKRTE